VTFGGKDRGQRPVDRRRRHRIVAAFAPGQLADQPHCRDQRKEQAVEMGGEARAQPGLAEHALQAGAGVAALVMMRDVVRAPHPRRPRHRQEDPSARRELGLQAGECGDVAGDVLKHVEQHDQVISAVVERHVGQIAALELEPAAPFGKGARAVVGFDRVDRPVALEQREVRAGASADLEDAQRPLLGPVAVDQPRDNPSPGDEPPMVLVDLGHAVIGGAVHQASPPWCGSGQPTRSRTM